MTWGKFIIAAWGVVLALSLMTSALPASWWFEPGAVRVSDARRGVCAKMDFDREINRPFFGTWKVTVMRKSSGGSWYTFRIFSEENDYRPDNSLPEDLNICWWIWEDSIDLPPGEYRINTLWRIFPTAGGVREVRRTSNTFEVTP